MASGIYSLTNPDGEEYIGFATHLSNVVANLRKYGAANAPLLRASLEKHGVDAHQVTVLVKCQPSLMDALKEDYLAERSPVLNSVYALDVARAAVALRGKTDLGLVDVSDTSPRVEQHQCQKCQKYLPSSEFDRHDYTKKRGKKYTRKKWCRTCCTSAADAVVARHAAFFANMKIVPATPSQHPEPRFFINGDDSVN